MNIQADVCIVGAGPSGALLSYILAKHGISVLLLERHSHLDKEFRGEHINQDGEAVLKKHHLYQRFGNQEILPMEKVEYWDKGKVVKEIWPDKTVGHLGIHVPQKHLLTMITKEALAFPHFSLLLHATVTNLVQDGAGKIIGVKGTYNNAPFTVHCKLLVGADGRFSTVRKLAKFPTIQIKHGYDLLWARIPAPSNWAPTIRMAMANDRQLSLFTQVGGFIQIGWNIEEGSFPMLKKQPFEPFLQALTEAFPELERMVREQITSWNDFVLLPVRSSQSATWVQPGVVIIGDAAHTMSPTGAFGLNSSLLDADLLAEYLIPMFKKGEWDEKQLKQFEQIRRIEVEQQQKEQLSREATFKQNFFSS